MAGDAPAPCELCGREGPKLTRHHLIPRTRHASRRSRRDYDREQLRERVAWLCSACHRTVHAVLSEKELEAEYNRVERLAAHPEIARAVQFIRRQDPSRRIRVKAPANRRPGRRR